MQIRMPKNIFSHKSKIVGSFTVRQALWGGLGGFLGVMFMIFGPDVGQTAKTGLTVLIVVPFLCMGFVELYELPLEKALPILIKDNFILPLKRYYKMEYEEFYLHPELIKEDNQSKKKKKKKQPKILREKDIKPSKTIIGYK